MSNKETFVCEKYSGLIERKVIIYKGKCTHPPYPTCCRCAKKIKSFYLVKDKDTNETLAYFGVGCINYFS